MKKQNFILTALLAISINCFGGNTMILLQENGGKFTYIDTYVDGADKAKIEGVIDKVAESFVVTQSMIATNKYSKFINLTDANCTRTKLLNSLIAETNAGNTIDLYIHGHGETKTLILFGGEKIDDVGIRALLTDAHKISKPSNKPRMLASKFKLRLVYMGNCVAAPRNQAWLDIGAQTSLGAACINHLEFPASPIFLQKFVNENKTVAVAADEAWKEATILWTTADAFTLNSLHWNTVGCAPFNNKLDCCQNIDKNESSKKVVAGNRSLRFDPSKKENPLETILNAGFRVVGDLALSGAESLENVAWQAGNYVSNALGDAATPGKYRIVCYGHSDKTKKYLTRPKITGTTTNYPGSAYAPMPIYDHNQYYLDKKRTDGTQIFEIKKHDVNYWIMLGDNSNRTVAYKVGFLCSVESGEDVDDYSRLGISQHPGTDACGNQHWWFFKLNNTTPPAKYLIKTQHVSGMVLDAKNDCSSGWCNVNIYPPESNDQTQIWVLEEVN